MNNTPGDLWEKGKVIWLWGASDISNPLRPILQEILWSHWKRQDCNKGRCQQITFKPDWAQGESSGEGIKQPVLPARARLKDEREGRAVFIIAGTLLAIFTAVLNRYLLRFYGRKEEECCFFLQIMFLHTQAAGKRFNKKKHMHMHLHNRQQWCRFIAAHNAPACNHTSWLTHCF